MSYCEKHQLKSRFHIFDLSGRIMDFLLEWVRFMSHKLWLFSTIVTHNLCGISYGEITVILVENSIFGQTRISFSKIHLDHGIVMMSLWRHYRLTHKKLTDFRHFASLWPCFSVFVFFRNSSRPYVRVCLCFCVVWRRDKRFRDSENFYFFDVFYWSKGFIWWFSFLCLRG